VGILGTGDEIVPVGESLRLGQVHDSNAYALAAAVGEVGGLATRLGIVPDERSVTRQALADALRYDVVLSTGGVSMGDYDYVKEVMAEVGLERRFWRVAQKPGKPITFAVGQNSLYFGLPGNPVSAMVCFVLYVGPALRRMMGSRAVFPPTASVTMSEDVSTAKGLTELVRCVLDPGPGGFHARPTGTQSSGALRSLSLAQALVISPPGTECLMRGSRATALLLGAASSPVNDHPFS
jgi:molybdopterin molybdotransferase